jgi:hypothetical protein
MAEIKGILLQASSTEIIAKNTLSLDKIIVLSVLWSYLDVVSKGYSAFEGEKISFHSIVVNKILGFCHIKILLDNNNNNYNSNYYY